MESKEEIEKPQSQSSLIALMLLITLLSCLAMYAVGYVVATNRFQQEAIRNRHAEYDQKTGEWRWTQKN